MECPTCGAKCIVVGSPDFTGDRESRTQHYEVVSDPGEHVKGKVVTEWDPIGEVVTLRGYFHDDNESVLSLYRSDFETETGFMSSLGYAVQTLHLMSEKRGGT